MSSIALASVNLDFDDNSGEGDVRVGNLRIVTARAGKGSQIHLGGAITGGTIETSIENAPQLKLTILDEKLDLLRSSIFDHRIDCVLDGVPFRLTQISLDDDSLNLSFEHRIVAWLRTHNSPKHWARGRFTRAEVVQAMVEEVKKGSIRFIAPDLYTQQPVVTQKSIETSASKKSAKKSGFNKNVKFKIKGKQATRTQINNVERALDTAVALRAPQKAVVAMLCAGIGESDFVPQINSLGYGGVFQGQVNTGGHYFTINDTEAEAESFLKGTKGFGAGGAIKYIHDHPTASPGEVATKVEVSGKPSGFYGIYEPEAKDILTKYKPSGDISFLAGGRYFGKYEFTRGVNGEKEDSWTCIQRLADEVKWRAFIQGRSTLYYVSDTVLIHQRPRYIITPDTEGLLGRPNFDIEVGQRTVVTRGHRQPKLSECTIRMRASRWAAPAGSSLQLLGWGVADGVWIVDSTSRSLFDAEMTVQLRQNQKPLPEPAPDILTDTQGSKKGKKGKLAYAANSMRAGTSLKPYLIDFLELVAGEYGSTLTITTGTNHNQFVLGTTHQSLHWTGQAADIGVGGDAHSDDAAGRKGDQIASAVLRVLGFSSGKAMRAAHSGALDFNSSEFEDQSWHNHPVEIGWRTMNFGNHWNHVHIGLS